MDSTILSNDKSLLHHFHRFLAPAVGNNSQWLLCYRASSDGWSASTFHSKCDNMRNTVTIIESGVYVFGGFTDIPWGEIFLSSLS